MNENEQTILRILQKNKGYCLTYKSLSFVSRINEREVRAAVASLVTDYQVPIGASQSGYFLIENDDDFKLASAELISRIKKLSARHRGLRLGYIRQKQDYKPKQLELV
jgi:hypothetical protein